jgi:hypothetical protein
MAKSGKLAPSEVFRTITIYRKVDILLSEAARNCAIRTIDQKGLLHSLKLAVCLTAGT